MAALVGEAYPFSEAITRAIAGYIVGFAFCLGAHEIVAWATRQQSETGRYLKAIDWTHIIESSKPPADAALLASRTMVVLAKGLVWLMFVVIVAATFIGLRFQTELASTRIQAVALIVGAAAAGEIVLPCLSRLQRRRMAQRKRAADRCLRARKEALAAAAAAQSATTRSVVNDREFPFTLPTGRS